MIISQPQPITFRCPDCGSERINPSTQYADGVVRNVVNVIAEKRCIECWTEYSSQVPRRPFLWPHALRRIPIPAEPSIRERERAIDRLRSWWRGVPRLPRAIALGSRARR